MLRGPFRRGQITHSDFKRGGNGDSAYRPRMLRALAEFDLDQVIILTHDEEVHQELYEGIKKYVNQTFLLQFDAKKGKSDVLPDRYFGSAK